MSLTPVIMGLKWYPNSIYNWIAGELDRANFLSQLQQNGNPLRSIVVIMVNNDICKNKLTEILSISIYYFTNRNFTCKLLYCELFSSKLHYLSPLLEINNNFNHVNPNLEIYIRKESRRNNGQKRICFKTIFLSNLNCGA